MLAKEPQSSRKQSDYIRFIINGNRIVHENENNYLIKFENNQTFWYPKVLVFKQKLDLTGQYLFTNLPHNESNPQFLQLSFHTNPLPFTDSKGKSHIHNNVEVRTKLLGELDAQGKQKYNSTKITLWDLRKHFAEESKLIITSAKEQKAQATNNVQNDKAQTLTLK